MLFQDALRQRLNIMQPSLQKVQEFLVAHPPRISKGENIITIKSGTHSCHAFHMK